jgi:hypothetical protein
MIGTQPNAELSSYPKPNTRPIFLFAPIAWDKALNAIRRIIGDDLIRYTKKFTYVKFVVHGVCWIFACFRIRLKLDSLTSTFSPKAD